MSHSHNIFQPSSFGLWATLGRGGRTIGEALASLVCGLVGLPALALGSRNLQKFLLAVAVLNISWQVQKHFFQREYAAEFGSLGGLQISLTNLALAGLYAAWLMRLAIYSGPRPKPSQTTNTLVVPAALFLFFATTSLYAAKDIGLGIFQVCSLLERFLLFLYIAKNVKTHEDLRFITRLLLIGLILQSVLMLAQVVGLLHAFDVYGFKGRADYEGDDRISGTLGSPNPAAAYLAISIVFALSVFFSSKRRMDRYLACLGVAIALPSLLFTWSRGGWLSLIAGFTVLTVSSGRRLPKLPVAALLFVIVLLVVCFQVPIQDRLFGDDRGSVASRMPLNGLAWAMIEHYPLLGVGANNFSLAMQPFLAHSFSGEFLYNVHNTYLLVWTEMGTGGVVTFVWFLLALIYQALKIGRSKGDSLSPIALGCGAAVVGFMIQMNFDPFREGAAGHLVWLFAGLIIALQNLSSEAARTTMPCQHVQQFATSPQSYGSRY